MIPAHVANVSSPIKRDVVTINVHLKGKAILNLALQCRHLNQKGVGCLNEAHKVTRASHCGQLVAGCGECHRNGSKESGDW